MRKQNFQIVSLLLRPAMRLLLTTSCFVVFAGLTQAQSSAYDVLVRGRSGPEWVDTGLYLPPNTILRLSATGEVDVSAGWGSHGPEGTEHFAHVGGYPVPDVSMRYGLVARLTTDVTLPIPSSPEVRARWTYPGTDGYFGAPHGGHLWLTVNDDNPGDNKGFFKVHLEVTTFTYDWVCHPCPFDKIDRQTLLGKPMPDPKALQSLLVLDGEIIAINQAGGTTLVTVSPGSVLAKYGDLPNLKVIFAKDGARRGPEESIVQGVAFQNNKMSLITGASRLKDYPKANSPETKSDTKQTKPD